VNKQQGLHAVWSAAMRGASSALRGAARALCAAVLLTPLLAAQAQTASSTSLTSSANPGAYGQSVTLTASVTGDAPSGSVTFMDGSTALGTGALADGTATFSTDALTVGSHSLTAAYAGDTNNTASTSPALTQSITQAASSTSLASSANPSGLGQSITLTAAVSGASPTGSVTFKDGAATLGSGALADGVATFNTSTLSIATHNLSALYAGDANNTASTSAALAQVVGKAVTTSSVTVNTNPSNLGSSVTFTASVTGVAPTGSVTFKDGATTLSTVTLSGSGNTRTAAWASSSLILGSHSITVVYNGDASNATSTSPALTQTINPANTTSSVSASPGGAAIYGSNVTFTGSLYGQAPTGTVTFMDGATALGTGTLSGSSNPRTATLATNTLAIGSHSITLAYAGDANNNPSTSSALNYTVNKVSTTTTLTNSANPSTYGQSITLTANVTGAGNPGGTVTFKDGGTTLGTAPLVAGVASFDTSALGGGSHTLYAYYDGDATNATSSGYKSHTVNKLATTTTLSSSVNPSTAGQSVTYTAAVTGINPSGSVTFKDGSTTLGYGNPSNGVANYASSLIGGSHNLTAVYPGDANHAASTSAAYLQVVNPKPVTLTLNNPGATFTLGSTLTLSISISGASFSPTGTITFYDGGAALATVNVGTSLSLSTLGLGTHSLTASYSGDASNLPATSSAVTVTVNPAGGMTWQNTAWSYGYDAMGRRHTVINPFGLGSYSYYDSLGRLIQTQQPPKDGSTSPTIIGYSYNAADALTQVADPRNLATNYTPDGLGQVASQASPDSGTSQYTYDAAGNVLTSTDARSKTTSYSYDVLNRLTTLSYPTGVATTFEYDGGASPSPAESGELTKMSDESGQTSYAHNSLGRLVTKTVVINGKTFTTGYSWGDSGGATDKLTAITYPSGNQVNYSYDEQGRLSAVSVKPVNANGVGVQASAQALLTSISYNAETKLTGWLWSDGKARSFGYDSYGQISSYSLGDPTGSGSAAGVLRTLARDGAGRITGYSHTNAGNPVASLDQSFVYDKLDRLTTATLGATTTQYSYDATGNRTAKTVGGTSYSNTVAATSNRYTQVQDVGGSASITHDAAGHIQADGNFTYTYSDRGRMSGVVTASGTVNYLYNGLNQRVYKSGPSAVVPSGASYYLYDEAGQLLGEYDANGSPIYETIYLGSLPVGAIKQTGSAATSDIAVSLYNVHADHIATPRLITKQDQTIVWRWDTAEAFGATVPDQNPSGQGAFAFNQRFPGQVFDAETGLFQNWNREYNARTGRYTQSDPIGLSGGINTFAYVGGNPMSRIDPFGLAVFRGPGNSFSDIPQSSGCMKPIWLGGYIMGWEPCDPPPDVCESESGRASPGSGDGWGGNWGPKPGSSGPGSSPGGDGSGSSPSASTGVGGSFGGFSPLLLGCTSNGSIATGGLSVYGGCGVGIGGLAARWRSTNSLNFGDPSGWGLNAQAAAGAFGGAGSLSVFITTTGVSATVNLGNGGGGTGNVTAGYRGTRKW
jgi:RHS repeat-associated protein